MDSNVVADAARRYAVRRAVLALATLGSVHIGLGMTAAVRAGRVGPVRSTGEVPAILTAFAQVRGSVPARTASGPSPSELRPIPVPGQVRQSTAADISAITSDPTPPMLLVSHPRRPAAHRVPGRGRGPANPGKA